MTIRLPVLLLTLALIAAACTSSDSQANDSLSGGEVSSASSSTTHDESEQSDSSQKESDGSSPEPIDLNVALIWHQHQPRYPVVDGIITKPWVRLHAAKDYVDMATLVEEFPELELTINLTPVLLDQLVELESGVRDSYWVAAATPIEELDDRTRQFLRDRFFDVNPVVLEQFPRYRQLRAKRDEGADYDDQDLQDLRTLFHLAWLDPEMPEYEALLPRALLADPGFTDADTAALLAGHERLVAEVIPTHARLWESEQIEIITTPLAHPILPLLADTSLALEGDPSALLPRDAFREYGDAEEQVRRGLDRAEQLLGQRPNGMWPGEGAVAQTVMPIFAEAGVSWVATGEDVLAQSLHLGGFSRDENDLVLEAAELYQPRVVSTRQGDVHMFFRDNRISDLIGFEYSGRPAAEAADDLVTRLLAIREALGGTEGGHTPLVTIVLDGENAWEHYPNDGRDFLRALYTRLTTTDGIATTTPSRFLADHSESVAPLEEVFPAAWFSPDFATWIGEAEEQRAWELLRRARLALRSAEQSGDLTAEQREAATRTMLEAEGSDWFWWYGSDQDSGDDRSFDDAYRELLGQVYDAIDEPRPRWVSVPIIPDPAVEPDTVSTEARTIEIDGNPADWEGATSIVAPDSAGDLLEVGVAIDEGHLAIRLNGSLGDEFEIYLRAPRGTSRRGTTFDDQLLGFDATHLIRTDGAGGACVSSVLLPVSSVGELPRRCEPVPFAESESGIELSIPTSEVGALAAGDRVFLRMRGDGARLAPAEGPLAIPVPDIAGFDPLLDVIDPADDDTGPGTTTYPTDPVFVAGSYDLRGLQAGTSGDDVVFSFEVAAAVSNPWGSPTGLSIQTFDVYLDVDPGAGTGRSELLDGRAASLPATFGWEAAVTVEGWDAAVATAEGDGTYTEAGPTMSVSVLGAEGRVTVRVPRSSLPDDLDLTTAGIAVAVLSQEGFPTPGVRRVRDVAPSASQWQLGGGATTRVIDALDSLEGSSVDALAAGTIPVIVSR